MKYSSNEDQCGISFFEQILYGSYLYLFMDTKSVLCFNLGRICMEQKMLLPHWLIS